MIASLKRKSLMKKDESLAYKEVVENIAGV
jgi:hypothetical protein